MNHLRVILILLLVLVSVGSSALRAAPVQPAIPEHWIQRLESLRPEQPLAYFELAEEIADEAQDAEHRALAQRLYALAGLLDTPRLGRSACLGVARIEMRDHLRRRLLAMASLLGASMGGGSFMGQREQTSYDESTVLSVMNAFSFYRRGLGMRALRELRKPDSRELLESLDHLLRGGSARFLENCRLYNGQVKPTIPEDQLVRMLKVELALLSGRQRSWSSELLLSSGSPLIEIEVQRLDEVLGVDPSRCLYRDGRWIRP